MLEYLECLGLFWFGMGLKMFFRSYPLKHISTQSSKTSLEIFFFVLWWKRYKSIKMFCTVFFLSLSPSLWPVLSAVGLKSEVCSLDKRKSWKSSPLVWFPVCSQDGDISSPWWTTSLSCPKPLPGWSGSPDCSGWLCPVILLSPSA